MALATRPPSSTQPQPDPDLQTGLQYLRAGWFDRAEPLFRSALARHGERPDILHFLAVCCFDRENFLNGFRDFDRIGGLIGPGQFLFPGELYLESVGGFEFFG